MNKHLIKIALAVLLATLAIPAEAITSGSANPKGQKCSPSGKPLPKGGHHRPKPSPKPAPREIYVREYYRSWWWCNPEEKVRRAAVDAGVGVTVEKKYLGCFTQTVFFTVGGTEANVRFFEHLLKPVRRMPLPCPVCP